MISVCGNSTEQALAAAYIKFTKILFGYHKYLSVCRLNWDYLVLIQYCIMRSLGSMVE